MGKDRRIENSDFARIMDSAEATTREMLLASHDDLGLVLKCHLIAEEFLTNYLKISKGIPNIENAKLSFTQKTELLDESDGMLFTSRARLRELNGLRNKFGHNFNAVLEIKPNGAIAQSVKAYLEGAASVHSKIIALLDKQGAEPDQVEALRSLLSEMWKTPSSSVDHTGDDIAKLSNEEPREMLVHFVRSFCVMSAIELFHRKSSA